MKRREFITLVGSAAVWPLVARAQQPDRMRRIGVLMGYAANDPRPQPRLKAFVDSLQELGWRDGSNARLEIRWAGADVDRMQQLAKELVGLEPDVIVGSTTPVTAALQRETKTIPIVFATVSDPVGDGFAASLAHPGGNITGFINLEESMTGKWLELLKELDPQISRAAIIFNPNTAPGSGSYFLPSFEAAARSRAITPITIPVRSDSDIESAISAFGRERGGGLIMMSDLFMTVHRAVFIEQAARHKIPAIFPVREFCIDGGLLSYGPVSEDEYRRVASYVDRILRGAKPIDLPVQVPTKFALVINLKTAKALGLDVPSSMLARADEVIE